MGGEERRGEAQAHSLNWTIKSWKQEMQAMLPLSVESSIVGHVLWSVENIFLGQAF